MSLRLPTARRALLWEVAQRLPAGRSGVYAVTGLRRGDVTALPVAGLREDEFYEFEEDAAHMFSEAVIEWAARTGGGRLTVTCPSDGEFRSHRHRWQKIALRFDAVRLLTTDPVDAASDLGTRVEAQPLRGHPLQSYRLVLREGKNPVVFVARYAAKRGGKRSARLSGFFSFDEGVVGDVAEDVELLRHRAARELTAFVQRELLHRAMLRVHAELESCRNQLEQLRGQMTSGTGKKRAGQREKPPGVFRSELEKITQRALAMLARREGGDNR
ncbi:MAG: hypothetical protein NZ483_09725 [Verrucomicrobiae bacterium]|nr:hypothetical protein [Verrucomicrobiae bacterium]MDW8343347.1 hypothetical protein [Verrucomicrobiae bacterium]